MKRLRLYILIPSICAIAVFSAAQMVPHGETAGAAGESSGTSFIRDPFWPVEYEPGAEERLAAEAEAEARRKAEEDRRVALGRVGPVTKEEWNAAEKNLPRQSTIFTAPNPNGDAQDLKMMIGGKGYSAGDSICFTNDAVEFIWKIDSISFNPPIYEKSRVAAERVLSPTTK